MKHLVAGTAGHIDHGKTVLVRALTGIETDRLPEEKRRGISIELGYAYLDLPGDVRVGLVDVPGHERFVRTMVAGAAGIDFAMLVVAADDSVMPQTREHLAILRLLDIRDGLVAVTKCDLVDDELVEVVVEEVRDTVAGTFLADAPILPCSGITGAGLDALRAAIAAVAARLPERRAGALARLPIDRSFSMAGHGTVVTGTVFHGVLHEGEEVVVLPRGERARVRGLQSHGQSVERVGGGQRAAINLAGIKHHELSRGDVVCTQGAFLPTLMVDGRVELDISVGAPLRHGASVGFHLGTAEVPGRLALLDRDALPPGDQAWAQVRLSAPVVARRGDRFILRTVGGDATLGGGFVLDAHPVKHRRHRAEAAERLECLAAGGLEEAVAQELSNAGTPVRLGTLCQRLGEERSAVDAAARAHGHLAPSGGDPWVYDDALLTRARESIEAALAEHHARKPLLPTGLTAAELAAKMGFARAVGDDLVTAMATALEAAGHVRRVGTTFVSADHRVALSARQQVLCDHILDACRQSPFAPPTVADLAEQLGATSAADVAAVHESLLATGQLVDGGVCGFHPEAIDAAWQCIEAHLRQHGQATVSALREALGTSRRYALPLLQHFDALGRLVREGDQRRLPDPA